MINNAYLRNITVTYFSVFYLQDGGRKTAGIDMKQNYVTVTLCISLTSLLSASYVS